MTFDEWCKALRRQLLYYGYLGHTLSNHELRYCWQRGWSVHTAYDISSDVANGFSFEEAVAALKAAMPQVLR